MKCFKKEFFKFLNKIKRKEPFSLSRFGDGELSILKEKYIDNLLKGNGEFRYDPKLKKYCLVKDQLLSSFIYQDRGYYVGIPCSCCVGKRNFNFSKDLSGQYERNLTWANLFVNYNYHNTKLHLIPELKKHVINLVINKNANLEKLPFKIKKVWFVGSDAWYNDFHLITEIKDYIVEKKIQDEIFLFAAGPLSNILAYNLWLNASKKNTYIDIGSILDPYLGLKITRGYLKGESTINKICIWYKDNLLRKILKSFK